MNGSSNSAGAQTAPTSLHFARTRKHIELLCLARLIHVAGCEGVRAVHIRTSPNDGRCNWEVGALEPAPKDPRAIGAALDALDELRAHFVLEG